jgi:hypothetical protein
MAVQEAPPAWEEESTRLEAVGWSIPAAITLPGSGAPESLVVLVPGSLYSDVDGDYPMFNARPHAQRDLARQLASRGHGVIRYAKRGPGTGADLIDPSRQEEGRRFRARVTVVDAALALLQARVGDVGADLPSVAAGHSEGAVVASMAAERGTPPDGVVILSGPAVAIFGIMREQLPLPPGSPREAYAAYDRVVATLRAGGALPELDPNDPTLQSLAFVGRAGEAAVRYMVQIDAVDPVATLKRVMQPVLIVQGGRDSSVPAHHADALSTARDATGLPTELASFPDLTHFYKVAPEGIDPMAAFLLDTESDPAVSAAVDDWIRRTFG